MHDQHFHLLVFPRMAGMAVLLGQPCLPPDVHKDGPVFPFAFQWPFQLAASVGFQVIQQRERRERGGKVLQIEVSKYC